TFCGPWAGTWTRPPTCCGSPWAAATTTSRSSRPWRSSRGRWPGCAGPAASRCKGGEVMTRPRVLAAMSGGVDSSVAAALLLEQGYDVIGVTMQVWPDLSPAEEVRRGGCCSITAVNDAQLVADALGIPYYVLDMQEVFERTVIDYFVREYARGRTPNPCIACNKFVKFEALLQ